MHGFIHTCGDFEYEIYNHEIVIHIMLSDIKCFIIAITLVTEIFVSDAYEKCKFETRWDGKLLLDCAHSFIESLPEEFDTTKVEVLNISHTQIESFHENNFKEYPKLKILEMRGLIIKSKNGSGVPDTVWVPLTELEYLDITGTFGNYKFPTKLPVSIKYLHINELEVLEDNFDLTMLSHLEVLGMAQTTSNTLPRLNKEAPLVSINLLQSQSMRDLRYEQLAPFCLLKTLLLDSYAKLKEPQQIQQCCGLLIWAQKYDIEGINSDFRCYAPCDPSNTTISPIAEEERYICLVRNGLVLRRIWFILLLLIFILLLLAFLGYLLYRARQHFSLSYILDHFVAKEKMEEEEVLSDEEDDSVIQDT